LPKAGLVGYDGIMFLSRPVVLLVGFLLGLALIAFVLVSLLPSSLSRSSPPKGPAQEEVAEAPSSSGSALASGMERREGLVLPLDEPTDAGATHQLMSESGEPILLLKTDDDKLRFSEGFKVAVIGKIRRVGSGEQVMEVTEVAYLID